MFRFLVRWPTLSMFPILVVMDVHLAHSEEREDSTELGEAWRGFVISSQKRGRSG